MENPVCEAFIKTGTKVYHINDGFYFNHHMTKRGRVYLRCVSVKKTKCPVRLSIAEEVAQRTVGDVRYGGKRTHNHPPMRDWFELHCARYRCLQRSIAETSGYRLLYNQETSQLPVDIAGNLRFKAVSQAMYRARKRAHLEISASQDAGVAGFECPLDKLKEEIINDVVLEPETVLLENQNTVKQITERNRDQATFKRESMKTGGGPPATPPGNSNDPIDCVFDTIVQEIPGDLDSDTVCQNATSFLGFVIDQSEFDDDNTEMDVEEVSEAEPEAPSEPVINTSNKIPSCPAPRVRTGNNRLRRNDSLRGEVDARVIRTRRQMEFDRELNALIKREQLLKIETAELLKKCAETDLALKKEEYRFKTEIWKLELEKMKKQ